MFDESWKLQEAKYEIEKLEKELREKDRKIQQLTTLHNQVVEENRRLKAGRR